MSSTQSEVCECCSSVISPAQTADLLVSVVSQPTQTDNVVAGHNTQPVAALLAQNNALRAEILTLENLICEKYVEVMTLQNVDPLPSLDSTPKNCTSQHKLQQAVSVIDDLERFALDDGLNEDAVDEYIRYLEYMYTRIPIVGPDAVQTICYSPLERTRQYLQSRKSGDEKVMFVLKDDDRYSLILYDASNACLYHYDLAKERSDQAQQLVFTLRQCLDVRQVVDVQDSSIHADSALYCVDNMIKIILAAEEESATAATMTRRTSSSDVQTPTISLPPPSSTPVQLLQAHSQPDHLKIIIMSRYIVTKLSQIENLCSGNNVERRWSTTT